MSAWRFPHRPGPPGFASKPCAPHAQTPAGFRCPQSVRNPLCCRVATIKKGQKLPMARSDSGRLRWCRPPVARLSHAHRPSRPCVGGPDPWRVADSEKQRRELDPVRKGVEGLPRPELGAVRPGERRPSGRDQRDPSDGKVEVGSTRGNESCDHWARRRLTAPRRKSRPEPHRMAR